MNNGDYQLRYLPLFYSDGFFTGGEIILLSFTP